MITFLITLGLIGVGLWVAMIGLMLAVAAFMFVVGVIKELFK